MPLTFSLSTLLTLIIAALISTSLSANTNINKNTKSLNNESSQINSQQLGVHSPVTVGILHNKQLGGIFELRYSKLFAKKSAFLLGVETGSRNYRASATFGHEFTPRDRAKATIEKLWQEQEYTFNSGATEQWLSQYGLGVQYEHLNPSKLFSELRLSANYVKAESKNLDDKIYGTSNDAGDFAFNNQRRLAGGTRKDISLGVTANPRMKTKLKVGLHYDDIKYDTRLQAGLHHYTGIGATLDWTEQLTERTRLSLSASTREAYNHYQARISHPVDKLFIYPTTLSIIASRQDGKHGLDDDNRALLQLDFGRRKSIFAKIAAPQKASWSQDDLLSWTNKPAVYEPRILAITDEQDEPLSLPDVVYNENTIIPDYLTAAAFKNQSIGYSVTGLPNGLDIDSNTGIISGTTPEVSEDTIFRVTVTVVHGDGHRISLSFKLTVLNVVVVASSTSSVTTTTCSGDPLTTIGTIAVNNISGACALSGVTGGDELQITHNAGATTINITANGGVAIVSGGGNNIPSGSHTVVVTLAGTSYTIRFDITDTGGATAQIINTTVSF